MKIYKKFASLTILLIATITSLAYVTVDFPGWDDLIQYTPYIVIVQSKASPEPTRIVNGIVTDNPLRSGRRGGITMSDIDVISVLKGTNVHGGGTLTLWSE